MKTLLMMLLLAPCISHAQTCDASLWKHVYHGRFRTAQARLHPIKPCITVTGTLKLLRVENDGDAHYRLTLDPQFRSLLLPANASQKGTLVVEWMCVTPPIQHDTVAEGVCNNWGQKPPDPSFKHVAITGAYVKDMEHGWAEIHPVTSVKAVP